MAVRRVPSEVVVCWIGARACSAKRVASRRYRTSDVTPMWKALLAGLAAYALAEDEGSCMLQSKAHEDKESEHGKLIKAHDHDQGFCKGPPGELNFNSFSHGDEITKNALKGIKITGTRRATSAQPGQKPCPGPLRILDTRAEQFPSIDKDLQRCGDCRIMLWAKDNLVNLNKPKVNDCGEKPGAKIEFDFKNPQDLVDIELWDLEEPTFVELYGKNGLITNISAPDGPEQDGNPAIISLLTKKVTSLVVYLGGSGGVRRIRACKFRGSIVGDPHIYTLDGEKFDLYENGTFNVFHYSGQKLAHPQKQNAQVDWQLYSHYGGPLWTTQALLLVDQSMGRFRQALELTAKDCKWRSKTGDKGQWKELSKASHSLSLMEDEDYVTSFEYVTEKKVVLRMKGEHGMKDTIVLNTICKPGMVNLRVTMPDMAESRFLSGQIEVGDSNRQLKKFQMDQDWNKLGGTKDAAEFIQKLDSSLSGHSFLLAPCSDADHAKAEKICTKHLGKEMRDEQLFEDCVADVCRGGEDFAVAAAELELLES